MARRKKKGRRPRRTRSLEERVEAIVAGRTTSVRRVGEILALVRRADRVDLLERIASAGGRSLEPVLQAALGSPSRHVLGRNEVRREVFVRFATTSASRAFLATLRDHLVRRYPDDRAATELVERRIEALVPRTPVADDRLSRTLRLAAESQATASLDAMCSVAVELDLLAREATSGENGLPPRLDYRIRRARETLRAQLARLDVEAYGRPGETVPFDARLHDYIGLSERVVPGMPVQLVTLGFQRASKDRPVIVQKAQVE